MFAFLVYFWGLYPIGLQLHFALEVCHLFLCISIFILHLKSNWQILSSQMPNGNDVPRVRDVRASKWLGQNHTIQMPFLNHINYTSRQREINIADHSLTIACDQPLFTLERYYILFSDCLHWCSKQHVIKYLPKFDLGNQSPLKIDHKTSYCDAVYIPKHKDDKRYGYCEVM